MRGIAVIGLLFVVSGCSRANPLFSDSAGDTDPSETLTADPTKDTRASDDETGFDTLPSTTGESTQGPGSDPTASTSTGPGETTGILPCAVYGPDCEAPGDSDCGPGYKCAPVGDPAVDEMLKCVPIAGNAVGIREACHELCDPFDGIDDCSAAAICVDGECAELCLSDSGECLAQGYSCYRPGAAEYALCLPTCDPLEGNCPEGETCVPAPDESWVCVDDRSEGTTVQGSPCTLPSECPIGFVCADPEMTGCAAPCCAALCSLEMPVCEDPLDCQEWPDRDQPGYEDVGYCGV